jgi:hypothetical protein
MARALAASLLAVTLIVTPAAPGFAGGHGGGGGHGGHGAPGGHGFHGHFHGHGHAVIVGGSGFWWGPWWWYDPAYAYPPQVVVQPAPVIVDERASQSYWYYCSSAKAYYPTSPTCPEAWIKVSPRAH